MCMGEIIAERVEEHNTAEEVHLNVSHSKCMLNEHTDFLCSLEKRGLLGTLDRECLL
jgi:hypothetical protein